MRRFNDLTGQRFFRLLVLRRATINKPGVWFECVCDCDETITVRSGNLTHGITRSCGCLREALKDHPSLVVHGHARQPKPSRTYTSWAQAKQRCTNRDLASYKWYGGRGIKMSERWLNSFGIFLADMGERPLGHLACRAGSGFVPEQRRPRSPDGEPRSRTSDRQRSTKRWRHSLLCKYCFLSPRTHAAQSSALTP